MPPPAGRHGAGGDRGDRGDRGPLHDAGAIAPAALRILQRLRAAEMGDAAPARIRANAGFAPDGDRVLLDGPDVVAGLLAANGVAFGGAAPPGPVPEFCVTDSDSEDYADAMGVDAGDDEAMTADFPTAWPRPPPCAWVSPGARFAGRQRVSRPLAAAAAAALAPGALGDWDVRIVLEEVDWAAGRVAGAMTATAAPPPGADAATPATTVRTVFTGDIIDNVNHTLFTPSYGVTPRDDARHWARFPGGAAAWRAALRAGGRAAALADAPFLLMRWKETSFVTPEGVLAPPGALMRAPHRGGGHLSIAGLYYVMLDRRDGGVVGYYWDPRSAPFQKLELAPVGGGGACVEYGYR